MTGRASTVFFAFGVRRLRLRSSSRRARRDGLRPSPLSLLGRRSVGRSGGRVRLLRPPVRGRLVARGRHADRPHLGALFVLAARASKRARRPISWMPVAARGLAGPPALRARSRCSPRGAGRDVTARGDSQAAFTAEFPGGRPPCHAPTGASTRGEGAFGPATKKRALGAPASCRLFLAAHHHVAVRAGLPFDLVSWAEPQLVHDELRESKAPVLVDSDWF